MVLSEQVMAERVQHRPLIWGVRIAAWKCRRKHFDRLSMFADDEVTNSENAAHAHVVGVQFDGFSRGLEGCFVTALHRVHIGQNCKREGRTRSEPNAAFRE